MVDLVTLGQAKAQCRVEDAEQDELIQGYVDAAIRALENRTGRKLVGDTADLDEDDAVVARQAVLMLTGHWFRNREASSIGAAVSELPMGVEYLITPLARLAV